jgi:hypothetical protein
MMIILRFSIGRLFIGREAASEGHHGGHTTPGTTRRGCTPPPGVVAPWPFSSSLSVVILRPRKIGVWVFVSSNSENISYVVFLKHKNNRKQGTDTMASCQ